jgi:hypothetical protein
LFVDVELLPLVPKTKAGVGGNGGGGNEGEYQDDVHCV